MRDAIRRWRRPKVNEAHERVEPGVLPDDATDRVLPPTGDAETMPQELDEEQHKRLYEIIREIGYVE